MWHVLHVLQMERWASRSSADKARVVLGLDKAEHLAAAEAVVQTVYGDAGALSQLRPRDMVQAVLLADMWRVDSSLVVVPGCSILQACSEWAEVLQALAAVPALPEFLLPVVAAVCKAWTRSALGAHADTMETLLLNTFGNLEAAWQQQETRCRLLALPPGCMLLLMQSSNLKVVSEDTVLFTVEAYIEEYREPPQVPPQQPVRHCRGSQALPPHTGAALRSMVRFHHLSKDGQLRALASGHATYQSPQVRSYMQLRLAGEDIAPDDIKRFVTGPPGRWDLPPRRLLAAATYSRRAEMSWTLSVADIKTACEKRTLVRLTSPSCTAPHRGQAWCLVVQVSWKQERQVTDVGVFCMAHKASLGVIAGKVSVRVQAAGCDIFSAKMVTKASDRKSLGWRGAIIEGMAGGWDEAAWVAKGLPLEGSLQLHLAVDDP